MAMIKLPKQIQENLSASAYISSYKRAVEELVYNALDADSTSIAIRINIEENSIQVIDNGIGVEKTDFSLLGQRYATSKCIDLSSLKSAPNKYGFRGLFLASLIEVSEVVKFTSRCEGSEDTWMKVFTNGKQSSFLQTSQRPSKGTTVEIKGFLYNLKIRKQAIDSVNEMNRIKTFLEQLSLVHSNVSLSLRNDSTNEIVFKVHKNRDIYQTLETLFGVDKKTLQEFKVEKNEYKVTGIISNNYEDTKQYHWIYLNGRIVRNTKLFRIVNDNFSKSMKLNNNIKKRKKKNFEEEDVGTKNIIPTYFIFITCPNYDFDFSNTPNQKTLEFRNWEYVTKIIEKLAKFYTGDINLKPINKNYLCSSKSKPLDTIETREKVKTIIKKILGSGAKKPAVSQMHKCVKGKLIKRKHLLNKKKDKKKRLQLSLSKVLPPKNSSVHREQYIQHIENLNNTVSPVNLQDNSKNFEPITELVTPQLEDDTRNKKINKQRDQVQNTQNHKTHKEEIKKPSANLSKINKHRKRYLLDKNKKKRPRLDPLAQKFESSLTESTKKRCDELAKKVDNLMQEKDKPKCEIYINENIQYSNLIRNNKSVSIRKKIDEIVIHSYEPVLSEQEFSSFDNRVWRRRYKNDHETVKSYDLLHTILQTQKQPEEKIIDNNESAELTIPNEIYSPPNYYPTVNETVEFRNIQSFRKLTYQSHNYGNMSLTNNSHGNNINNSLRSLEKKRHFITKESRDNFLAPQDTYNFRKIRQNFNYKNKQSFQRAKHFFHGDLVSSQHNFQSSVTIEFSSSKNTSKHMNSVEPNINNYGAKISSSENPFTTYTIEKEDNNSFQQANFGATYTVFSSSFPAFNVSKLLSVSRSPNEIILNEDQEKQNSNENEILQKKVIFVSESQEKQDDNDIYVCLNPSEICENHSRELQHEEGHESRQDVFHEKFSLESWICDRNIYTLTQQSRVKQIDKFNDEDISHHFEVSHDANERKTIEETISEHEDCLVNLNNSKTKDLLPLRKTEAVKFNFNFKNRFRFIPKGLSPIFENCRTKDDCDYILDKDYYNNEIYDNFTNEVQTNANVFEPHMQNIKELHSKAIDKVNNKVNKDHSALIFNGESIRKATVLNQVDVKFIAAKMFSKKENTKVSSEHLVLFDQHAVDERIRLEKCLEDYINDGQWKSHTLDEAILLKFDTDNIVYLNNYRDKFNQLGLQWSTSENTVIINSIPEAILGKHSRPVETVIRAVKDLILEQINAIKTQNGCLSSYPKSIMDLIFSEACRYAIKFGDKLSRDECVELFAKLSDCKTPFQCAHGRPVMAVLIDIKENKHEYKVNFSKLQQFVKLQKKKTKLS